MKTKWVWAIVVFVLAGLLVASSVLAGCAAPAPAPAPAPQPTGAAKPEPPKPAAGKTMIRWGTSSVGSTGYNVSAKMTDIVNRYTNIEASITPVGGAEATVRAINRGERDLGFGNTHAVYDGYNGVGTFAKEGKQPILLVAMVYTSTMTFLGQPGITSVPEFKGKTVSYRRAPSPLFTVFGDVVLKAYGMDPDKDVKNVTTLELREITDAMKTGSIDAGMIPGAIPGTTIPELFEAKPFNIIDLGKDKADAIAKQSPFMMPYLIKANTFKTLTKDAYTMGFVNVLCSKADLPENVVYEITKAVFSHLDELAGADPVAKRITAEFAAKDPVIPFHPGALKYYKEAGVIK
ncbi:MAG: TAXI family TRAP transporter solute-binding subunit [Dehalococcoidia bacterium]|nr:TAXI family TRAP transporter solute-binding subunit [Dehalococcoidia bacterium]